MGPPHHGLYWSNSSPSPRANLGGGGGSLGSSEPLFADLLVLIVTSSVFDTQSIDIISMLRACCSATA